MRRKKEKRERERETDYTSVWVGNRTPGGKSRSAIAVSETCFCVLFSGERKRMMQITLLISSREKRLVDR